MERDGRYPVTGLDALFAVPGVLLDADWAAYWAAEADQEAAYEAAFDPAFPVTAFAAGGYRTSLLEALDPAQIASVYVHVSWNDEAGKLVTDDPAVIAPIYAALSQMQAIGESTGEGQGQKWFVELMFPAADGAFLQSATFTFYGDELCSDLAGDGDESRFTVTGLDALLDAADAEVFDYLRANRLKDRQKPVF